MRSNKIKTKVFKKKKKKKKNLFFVTYIENFKWKSFFLFIIRKGLFFSISNQKEEIKISFSYTFNLIFQVNTKFIGFLKFNVFKENQIEILKN